MTASLTACLRSKQVGLSHAKPNKTPHAGCWASSLSPTYIEFVLPAIRGGGGASVDAAFSGLIQGQRSALCIALGLHVLGNCLQRVGGFCEACVLDLILIVITGLIITGAVQLGPDRSIRHRCGCCIRSLVVAQIRGIEALHEIGVLGQAGLGRRPVGAHHVVDVARVRDGRQDGNDDAHDHQLDQGEAMLPSAAAAAPYTTAGGFPLLCLVLHSLLPLGSSTCARRSSKDRCHHRSSACGPSCRCSNWCTCCSPRKSGCWWSIHNPHLHWQPACRRLKSCRYRRKHCRDWNRRTPPWGSCQ